MLTPKTPPARLQSGVKSPKPVVPLQAKDRAQELKPRKKSMLKAPKAPVNDERREKVLDLTGEAERDPVDAALSYLFDPKNALLTTELDNPMAITVLEIFGEDCQEEIPEITELTTSLIEKFKINMIPYKRKRVGEGTLMADAASGRKAERERARLSDRLLGRSE